MMREYASVWEEEGEQAGAIEGGGRSRSSNSSEDTAIWSPWFTETEDLRHTNYDDEMTMAKMGMTKNKRFIYSPEEIKNNLVYPLMKHIIYEGWRKKRNG